MSGCRCQPPSLNRTAPAPASLSTRGGARLGAGRPAGKSANTSPVSAHARARARVGDGNQRPWAADKVERWAIDRLIPYAKNARTHTDAQVGAIAASIKEWGWTTPALVGEDVGPLLRLAPARGDHHGNLGDPELSGGEYPGVARNQAAIPGGQSSMPQRVNSRRRKSGPTSWRTISWRLPDRAGARSCCGSNSAS